MTTVGENPNRTHDYELGHSDPELKRLHTQARLVDPMTRQFFMSAGVNAGMRVLDVGSGAGDVAFLVADLVGQSGEVVGTDKSEVAVNSAVKGAKDRKLGNVTFRLGDPTTMAFDHPFDAVVGRYVLMFSPDPSAMLRGVAGCLRPGGVIVFHEAGNFGAKSFPSSPTYDRCYEWVVQTFRNVGSNPRMCLDLYSAFLAAGLPAPAMGMQCLIGGADSKTNGIDLIADLATTLVPIMEQAGVATAAEINAPTLRARMHAELEANRSLVIGRYEVGAWARIS